ncbi:MAG: bile acid:sodium symporter [Bdellovibrionota bacterium]|nr:bile acid:sodium symporter [Bdellovibrionota bacterium]
MELSLTEKALFASFGFALVFYIGLSVKGEDLKESLKEKYKLLLGIVLQFFLSPLIAYFIGKFFNLDPLNFYGLLLLSMTPCGSIPNSLTMIAKGNSELSVAMTVTNSLASLVLMPLMAKVFLGGQGDITVPYSGILANLFVLILFIVLGVFINTKKASWAGYFKKGTAAILALSVLGIAIFSGKKIIYLFINSPSDIILISFLLPFSLYILGLLICFLFKLKAKDSKAISLGAGTYNSPLTMTLIVASFPLSTSSEVIKIPLLYTHTVIVVGVITAFVYSKFKGEDRL